MTSEGTDCQGQLVWPLFIYLSLNKRQVVALEKGTQTPPRARLCTDNTHTSRRTHHRARTHMQCVDFLASRHMHMVIIHLISKEPFL